MTKATGLLDFIKRQVCIPVGCVPQACSPYRGRGSAQPWEGSASRGVCPTLGGLPNSGGRGSAQPWEGLPNPGGLPNLGGGLPNPGGLHPGRVCLGGLHREGSAQVCLQGGVGQTPLPPPVYRMTHRCKNITLPQTSFASGKHVFQLLK